MKEPHDEGSATHIGPESCVDIRSVGLGGSIDRENLHREEKPKLKSLFGLNQALTTVYILSD